MWFGVDDPLCLEGFALGALGKQVSLWWRWLAVEGNGEKVPQLQAGEEPEREFGLRLGLELGLGQEKQEQQCGLQRCSGLHRRLHWLPEEAAGLMSFSVSALLLIGQAVAVAVAREVLGSRGR